MGLKEYERKRDFKRTPEPRGKTRARRGRLGYVIQKHDASRLHYDFRLEHDGVLLSWAVPKGPSLDPREKRLAVHVEDHPIDYGGFEGTIPEGEYGGGTVMLWDRGTWEPEGDASKDLAAGKLKFTLHGEKLRGKWMLLRLGGPRNEDGKNWLLFKEKDEYASATGDVLKSLPLSVSSGRDLEEIAGKAKRVWHSNRVGRSGGGSRLARRRQLIEGDEDGEASDGRRKGASKKEAAGAGAKPVMKRRASSRSGKASAFDPSSLEGARRGSLPVRIEAERATLVSAVPEGDGWIHEIKFDGYRILARVSDGKVRLTSRSGNDWTARFAGVADAVAELPVESAVFDGEVVALAPDGTSRFQLLQNALSGGGAALTYFVFDLLYLDGWDLRDVPLLERKKALAGLLPGGKSAVVRGSDHVEGRGPEFFQQACRLDLEGVVSKRRDSPYRSGKGRDWVKTKCLKRQEFVIGGWTDPDGARSGFGALLLGVYEGKGLVYAGRVGTGFGSKLLDELSKRFVKLAAKEPPFVNPPPGRGLHWLKPELVGEVSFTEWTNEGSLRHPSFQGLREDKPAKDVVRERAEKAPVTKSAGAAKKNAPATGKASTKSAPATRTAPAKGRAKARSSPAVPPALPAGFRLTNPDKVLWKDPGVTKAELAAYYLLVADRMLPELAGRPLMIKRCPEGIEGSCFFQKHRNKTTPEAVGGVELVEAGERSTYLEVSDVEGLLSLVQMGATEIHVWGSRAKALEKPDRLVFDLDPDPSVEWPRVVETARLLRSRLEQLGLESFPLLSGGKGLHVVVPVQPRIEWDEAKAFCGAFTQQIVDAAPDQFTATISKAKRRGKILIDWFRNGRGATAIAPWSTR
ncbi:MAG TPA: DNA ligase D, partial [Candidatus Polarisedimenticolaceae bacterium]|nr:DNA ligase D [Candidatus Polarisedimenticolaceae bacterium]